MTDKELIKGIRSGSDSAWRRLVESTRELMRRKLGGKLKDVREITFDDVFSEACISLMNCVKEGRLAEGDANLEGYLYETCRRIANRYACKKKTEDIEKVKQKSPEFEPLPGGPEEEAEDERKLRDFLDKVLDEMPGNQRNLLRHFYWDKMSMAEIAAQCGLKNEDSAKSLKNRYMNNFRKLAKKMLSDDSSLEAAMARTVERAALRDQLDECYHLESGILAASACKKNGEKLSESDIIAGIRSNSPLAWKALYATFFDRLQKDISPLLD